MSDPEIQVDLTNCDREPIHILGAVQPFGFMLVLSSDWMIVRASTNTANFLGLAPDKLIGKPLRDVLPMEAVHSLRNRVAMLRGPDSVERLFGCRLLPEREPFDLAVHMSGGQIVVEAEYGTQEHGDVTGIVRAMVARLEQTVGMPAFWNEGARQVRALTGFDRVMVYRFAPNGSGEVVAEAVKPGIGSFMGLHYPASDIPQQARALYKRNLLRIISDVDEEPVPIVPALDENGQPLDLSLSMLRSVSRIHIEYLKNMGVCASMSISIVVEGRLWGLFACHHYMSRLPSFERRAVCELFAQMFAMRLESRERQETMEFERRARDVSDQLLGAVASDETLLNDPDWVSDVLTTAIAADGVGVWVNGNYAFSGITPTTEQFAKIVGFLHTTAAAKVFATDHIASVLPGAVEHASSVAGMLAIPISRVPRDYVVLFRSELVRSVRWGGDPHKPAEYGPNGARLTPRKSFEEWKELVEGHSEPFTASELRVAETLRATLIEVVLRMSDEANAERKQSAARQELLIAELNHRVRNILAVIRGLVRQSKPQDGASLEDFVSLVDGRIHALARAHNQITDDHWGPAPFKALIVAEVAAFLAGQADRVEMTGPMVLLNPQAYSTMALVIHELVTNSAKYGSLSDSGRVDVSWSREDKGDLVIDWREHGGPRVKPPTRKGFGSTIISRSVPYDLGGKAKIEYRETGVVARFTIPARHVTDPTPHNTPDIERPAVGAAHGAPAGARNTLIDGKNVLLVEDSLIIALDAEDILKKLGAANVTTAASVQHALEILGGKLPDFAMLDINLGDHTSFAIADRLGELGIPFAFATGYGEQSRLPDQHKSRTVLQKPYTIENVARTLPLLLSEADGDEAAAAATDDQPAA